MNKIIVHVRRRNPGISDTFAFERSFDNEEAANRFISRNGYAIEPSEFRPSVYATVVN